MQAAEVFFYVLKAIENDCYFLNKKVAFGIKYFATLKQKYATFLMPFSFGILSCIWTAIFTLPAKQLKTALFPKPRRIEPFCIKKLHRNLYQNFGAVMSKNGNFDTNASFLISVLFWLSAFYFGWAFSIGRKLLYQESLCFQTTKRFLLSLIWGTLHWLI